MPRQTNYTRVTIKCTAALGVSAKKPTEGHQCLSATGKDCQLWHVAPSRAQAPSPN